MLLCIDTYINTRYLYNIGQHLFLFFRYIFDTEHDQIQTKFNENEVKKSYSNTESTVISIASFVMLHVQGGATYNRFS